MSVEYVIKPSLSLWKNLLAGFLSLVLPGMGQVYKGKYISGMLWFIFVVGGYQCLVVPGAILHFYCICYALLGSPKIKEKLLYTDKKVLK